MPTHFIDRKRFKAHRFKKRDQFVLVKIFRQIPRGLRGFFQYLGIIPVIQSDAFRIIGNRKEAYRSVHKETIPLNRKIRIANNDVVVLVIVLIVKIITIACDAEAILKVLVILPKRFSQKQFLD